MQLVIEISDTLKDIADNEDAKTFSHIVCQALLMVAIKNGTPLPKGHGRLGDLDFVAKRIKAKPPIGEIDKVTLEECYQEILQADTIIEADGGNI